MQHRKYILPVIMLTIFETVAVTLYGISMFLLVMRALQSKVISSGVAQNFYIKAGKAGWRTNEPTRIEREKPLLFEQLVFRAINEEDISIQKGVELLQIPYTEVEKGCALWRCEV